MDFSKFDKEIDIESLQNDIQEAAEKGDQFEETPDGTYITKVEKLEIGETKDGRPMLKAMFRITEGEYAKRCLFANRVLYGTKNDGNMIASAIGFLNSLDSGIDITFNSYSDFAELVLDVFEEIENTLEYEVDYQKDNFQSIKITDVFEI